jgi:NADH:ubiquinone oxidoreductase 24 kD subunit
MVNLTVQEINKTVAEIIDRHNGDPTHIIAILQDVQNAFRYLPKEAFSLIAQRLNVSIAKVYSVATFYENFSLEPKGRYVIKICDGTACHVRKSIPILEALRKHLSVSEQKPTTDDLSFTVETVSCLGACGLAPVLTVNDRVHPAMTPDKALRLIEELIQISDNPAEKNPHQDP